MTNTFIERDITSTILKALKEMPVVVVTGMRQTGKSTFLQSQPKLAQRRYVTFDDFSQLEAAKLDPQGFVDTDEPLTIDEAHKCPEVLVAIKRMVDKRRMPGQFLISGSANFALLKGISESLAGRAVYFTMHPFSVRELGCNTAKTPFLKDFFSSLKMPLQKTDIHRLKPEDVLMGGMPPVHHKDIKDEKLWFKGYEQTYLERDIKEISQIGNIISFRHLLHLAALRTGQLLNPSQLARDAKLSVATTTRHLSLLETSFIISRLNPYLRNKSSRLIKSSKLYISDSGIASYLTGVGSLRLTSDEPLKGAIFETYIAQNLFSIIDACWSEARLYYWNIQGRHEVDFIIETKNKCIAIEVKAGARWSKKDLSGLKAFVSSTPHCVAAILAYNGTEIVRVGEIMWAVPLSLVLS